MERKHYVYHWTRPDTGDVFYVGLGSTKKRDITPKRHNAHFLNIIAKLKRDGLEPIVSRISGGLTKDEAVALEVAEIARIGRKDLGLGPLCNLTCGGDGASGSIPTTAARVKIGAANRRRSANAAAFAAANAARREHWALGEARELARAVKCKAAPRSDNKSGYKGVSLYSRDGRWVAKIFSNGKTRFIGYFHDPKQAARAYDAAAIATWGLGDCYLNFPEDHGFPANDNSVQKPAVSTA